MYASAHTSFHNVTFNYNFSLETLFPPSNFCLQSVLLPLQSVCACGGIDSAKRVCGFSKQTACRLEGAGLAGALGQSGEQLSVEIRRRKNMKGK